MTQTRRTKAEESPAWEAAFHSYYDQYARTLLGLGQAYFRDRTMAEEMMQEAFVSLFTALKRGEAIQEPGRYLVAVVRNQARRHMQRTPAVLLELNAEFPATEPSSARVADAEKLWRLVGELPVDQREVVCLHVSHAMTFQGIATALDVPRGTVEKRYYTAIQRLQELWRD